MQNNAKEKPKTRNIFNIEDYWDNELKIENIPEIPQDQRKAVTLDVHRRQWNTNQTTRRMNIHFPIKILFVATSARTNLIYWLAVFPCGWQKRSEWNSFDKQPPELDSSAGRGRFILLVQFKK